MSPARLAAPIFAVVRAVPAAYVRCLREHDVAVDPARAREQHAGYVAALVAAGVEVLQLASDEALPDCCFVEDTAVVLGEHALVTCPGAPSRRGETGAIAAALASRRALQTMTGGATLDGGDVLRAGPLLWVGLSRRSNADGAAALARLAEQEGLEVRGVPLAAGLHLKSAVTLVDERTVVLHAGAVDPAGFLAAGLEVIAVDEPAGANVLALGARVLVSAAAPATADRLARRGVDVHVVDVSEFHKGDGALTCLSLRLAAPGTWCA